MTTTIHLLSYATMDDLLCLREDARAIANESSDFDMVAPSTDRVFANEASIEPDLAKQQQAWVAEWDPEDEFEADIAREYRDSAWSETECSRDGFRCWLLRNSADEPVAMAVARTVTTED